MTTQKDLVVAWIRAGVADHQEKMKHKKGEITSMKIEINDRLIAKIMQQATVKTDRQLTLHINQILKDHMSGALIPNDFAAYFFED